MKQAERDARRMYREQLRIAQESAAAQQKAIQEQIERDRAAREQQSAAYRADLFKIQQEAAAGMKAMQDQQLQAQMAAEQRAQLASRNQMAAEQAAGLQIRSASADATAAGSGAFKRRKDQFNIQQKPTYGGINAMKSGMINI